MSWQKKRTINQERDRKYQSALLIQCARLSWSPEHKYPANSALLATSAIIDILVRLSLLAQIPGKNARKYATAFALKATFKLTYATKSALLAKCTTRYDLSALLKKCVLASWRKCRAKMRANIQERTSLLAQKPVATLNWKRSGPRWNFENNERCTENACFIL